MMMKNLGGAGGADPSAAGGAGGLASLLGKSFILSPGPAVQWVTSLAPDASLTADPGIASLIPAPFPYFRGNCS